MNKNAKPKSLTVVPGGVLPKKELISYALGGMGQGMIYAVMSSYISDYYTNVLVLSPMFVLLLMLLARVWDAINDPLMGMIVDSHQTKHGKMKPYVAAAVVPIAIVTLMMFMTPSFQSKTVTMIYAAVVYVAWGMIYTMGDVPYWGLPNVMTPNADERARTISITKTINGIGSAFPMVVFMVLGIVMKGMDGTVVEVDKKKYAILTIICVVIGSVLYMYSALKVKERVVPPLKKKEPGQKGALYRIFHCKPLMLVVLMGVLSFGRYFISAGAVHVARYAFVGVDQTLIYTIINICSGAGLFGTMLFMPMLMNKFEYKKILLVTCTGGFISSIITTIVGWTTQNFWACAPFILIECIPLGVLNVLILPMICDSLDVLELETGYRDNGLGSALSGFINKLGNSLSTAGVSLVYLIMNLDPSTIVGAKATESLAAMLTSTQRFGMFSMVSLIPGISMLICMIPMLFYKIDKKQLKTVADKLAAKRAAEKKELAE